MTNKERLDRHDVQIAAIRKLIEQGTRLVVGTRQDIRLLAKDIRMLAEEIRTLAAAQKKTDANLNALISTLRRSGGNGHSKTKIDLQ
jgi:ABC-type Fe3+-citrate transport system substrate-binding protein